jgi:alkanesulfonate monooxygenase SsuD/methylene tetrahydromethanopterin reductase-like flavin-dependent oxidoreductase (luciferase family)
MRLSAVLSGVHPLDVDPLDARDSDRALVAAVRDRLDGITVEHGWSSPRWRLQALSSAAYLSADAGSLGATVRGLPLGVLNPVELAEQLATLDHAWDGRFGASVVVGSPDELSWHGIDADHATARFEQSLQIIREMWSQPVLSGSGPEFVFDEVRPTLRPRQEAGPPLALEVSSTVGTAVAAERSLGLHVTHAGSASWPQLVASYRKSGGQGRVSVCLTAADASGPALDELLAAGVAQVDVLVRTAETTQEELMSTVDRLQSWRRTAGEA